MGMVERDAATGLGERHTHREAGIVVALAMSPRVEYGRVSPDKDHSIGFVPRNIISHGVSNSAAPAPTIVTPTTRPLRSTTLQKPPGLAFADGAVVAGERLLQHLDRAARRAGFGFGHASLDALGPQPGQDDGGGRRVAPAQAATRIDQHDLRPQAPKTPAPLDADGAAAEDQQPRRQRVEREQRLSILFHHSNLRLPERWERRLALVLTTPRMHGIHHSAVHEETDSNWSSGLSFWDRLHGTFRLDVPQSGIAIGVPAYRSAEDVALRASLTLPFRRQRDDWEPPRSSLEP